MIFKVFGVLQFIIIQVISAQILSRDLPYQNALNKLTNTPLADYGRCRRQTNNSPVGLPGNGNLARNANGILVQNNQPNGNFLCGNRLTNNLALKNGFPNNIAVNNGLPNSPHNFQFPNINLTPQNKLLPSYNDIISNGLPFNNMPNGLPGINNVPNGLPSFNNVPRGLPAYNNELPGLSNVPNGLPTFNNVPIRLPSLNNGLPGLINNVPNGLPSLNNIPNGLPSYSNGWPNVLPGSRNGPNGLPNLNNGPTFTNVMNLNNVPAGSNILNLNNLPTANTLTNINNIAIPNELPSFNNLPCNSLTFGKGLPLNILPSGTILPPINNQLPYLNNFRITKIGIGNRVADINRFTRDNQPCDNIPYNANNLQNGNELKQQVYDDLTNMNNYKNNNGFSSIVNKVSANALPSFVPVDHRFSSVSHFPINSGLPNIGNDVQNLNNMQLSNGLPDVSHFQNHNAIPVNEQRFVNNDLFINDFAVHNNFAANTGMPNANSRLVNDINNGMTLCNEGHLNDILLAKRGLPESYSQNSDGNGFSSNDFQFGNIQVPVNNWNYDFVPSKVPDYQNSLFSEGVQMFSNVPNEYSSVLTSNNLNLAQELVKNLKIEGLANMPFLNGLPVAGITESVTVLNGPYSK